MFLSQMPQKCDAPAGLNFQSTPWDPNSPCICSKSKSWLLEPSKLFPRSSPKSTSTWIAREAKHYRSNARTLTLPRLDLVRGLSLMWKGPKMSSPQLVKGAVRKRRSTGKSAINCSITRARSRRQKWSKSLRYKDFYFIYKFSKIPLLGRKSWYF